jgi:pimeloyl-ACP methyl ester carboxylesterase
MTYPLLDFGGRGLVLQLAPANGFPPGTYRHLLDPLTDRFRVVCLPPRAMWPDAGEPPAEPGSWATLADELLEGMRHHDLAGVVGLGHSFGSVALLLAAVRDRARFRALCLLDPTIPPPELLARLQAAGRRLPAHSERLARGARERRAAFRNADEAFAYWREKPLFQDWSDDALWLYTHSMLRPNQEGGGFELSWSPAWEAHYYESLYTGTWADIERLDPSLPVLVIGGGASDTFLPDAAGLLRRELPQARVVEVAGHGHFFPLAAPEATRRLLESWLHEVVPEAWTSG